MGKFELFSTEYPAFLISELPRFGMLMTLPQIIVTLHGMDAAQGRIKLTAMERLYCISIRAGCGKQHILTFDLFQRGLED